MTASATGSAATAGAENSRGGPTVLRERLSGYQEDPAVVSSAGTAEVRLTIDETQQQISYVLSYRALEGTVTQAHIHFGGRAQSGGISVFLCTNAGNGPAGTQACPAAPGTVTGVLRAADVIGPAGQGIAAGQFDEFVRAIRANVTYVNVHSSLFPGGELRAQLQHRH
ncbi:MAG TPA: CHRD domain-containing protein [Pilimelia sp.]|nr:CHRD domain-containing protein [Pilimelia sp.]